MKIVILADSISSQSTGIHYYGLQLVKRIIREFPNNEYHLIATKKIEAFSEIAQTIIKLKSFPLHLRFRQVFIIPKVVKNLNPDHVIELAHFGPFRLPKKIKRTTVIHDLTPINYPQFHSLFSRLSHQLLLPSILNKANSIIVNSVCTKNDLEKFNPKSPSRTKVIFPEINIPTEIKTDRIIQGNYLLAVGTIEPRKNYETLLKAFKKIANEDSEIKLVIVGGMGWKMDHFNNLIEGHPYKSRITLTGYVDRKTLWSLYHDAFAFVSPSNFEGFGIPILEACYHGLPLLLSDIPTSKEIANDAALYFKSKNAKKLAQSTLALVDNNSEREKMSVLARKRYDQIINTTQLQLEEWYNHIS